MSKREQRQKDIQAKRERGLDVSKVKQKRITVRVEVCKVAQAKQVAKGQTQTFTSLVLSKVLSYNSKQLDMFTGLPEKIVFTSYERKSKTQIVEMLVSENEMQTLEQISIQNGVSISVLFRTAIDSFCTKPPQA